MSDDLSAVSQRKTLVKRLRNEVRLQHAILADRELEELLPKADAVFVKRLNKGELMDDADIVALVKRLTR